MAGMVWGVVSNGKLYVLPTKKEVAVYKNGEHEGGVSPQVNLSAYEGKTILIVCEREFSSETTGIYKAECQGFLQSPLD